jgi:hypothetical protein
MLICTGAGFMPSKQLNMVSLLSPDGRSRETDSCQALKWLEVQIRRKLERHTWASLYLLQLQML